MYDVIVIMTSHRCQQTDRMTDTHRVDT